MTAITRRTLLATSGMAAAAAGLPGSALARGVEKTPPDLFVGTGGDGHTYPGPTMPFGMVQVGPDTDNTRWEGCSGYHRTDTSIMGFSHTHLSGTGIGDLMDVLVVPTRGPVELVPDRARTRTRAIASASPTNMRSPATIACGSKAASFRN